MSQLTTTLKQLKLSGMGTTLELRLQEAGANRLSHLEFLELILQDEINLRHQKRIELRTRSAEFTKLKTLEDFDWRFNPTSATGGDKNCKWLIQRGRVAKVATTRSVLAN